ncbi:MAG: hypothetical protein WCA00_05450 [Candidatus Acidiferrales bacterium]
MSSPAQSVKTGEAQTPFGPASVPVQEFGLVDEASAESFPASGPPAWQFKITKASLKHAPRQ